jgi:hypothetical protein
VLIGDDDWTVVVSELRYQLGWSQAPADEDSVMCLWRALFRELKDG